MIFRLTSSRSVLVFNLALIFVALVGESRLANAALQSSTAPAAVQSEPQAEPQALADTKLDQLVKTAYETQQSGNLKLAASQWQSVWEQFPNSQSAGTARLRAGVCYQQLKDYPRAITNLKAAIPKLTDQLPTAKLLLGYCQFQLGQQQLETADDPAKQKQASDLLVTASRTLQQLLKTDPDFPDAFQAAYFLGGVYEELGQQQSAIEAYQKMATVPNPSGLFKYESIYAIGDLYFELGQYGQAKKYFNQFLAAPETKDQPDRGLVVYAAAETSIALGEAAKRNGVGDEYKQHFTDAAALLKTIVKPVGNDEQAITLALEAERQLAFCYRQLGRFGEAAEAYAAVYEKFDATNMLAIKTQTAIDAGESYLEAGDAANGEKFLKIAAATDGPRAAKGAHLLANFYLKQRRFGDAYKLSTQFIPIAVPPILVPLKMNQAEAAIEIEGKLAEAIGLFQSIATDYPNHELAAPALYNAAFGQFKDGQFEAAIGTADKFLQRYPNHFYLADVLEVKGNALSQSGQYSAAEKVFQQLIDDPSLAENPKRSNWVLSNAMAKFQQENFAGTIAVLKSMTGSFAQPAKTAKALYLLGVSHYQLGQYPEATKNLTAAIGNDGTSASADESQFYLGLSLLKEGRYELAQQTLERLATRSPDSPFLNQAYVELGNDRYQADQQQAAIKWFQKVIDSTQATPTEKVNAIHGAAWAYLKEQDFNNAQRLFKQVIETYPESNLVASAKTGLANAQKLAGVEPTIKIPDPIKSTADATSTKQLRETGLAQAKDEDWAAAVITFEKLVKADPDSTFADADLRELAWAYRSLGQEDKALRYFGEIAAKKPKSPYATEANFHLGKAAYDDQRYAAAVKYFGVCVGDDTDVDFENEIVAKVREKAAYKLAWAYYKQDKFPEAHAAFVRQTKLFPAGELLADGTFMAAESLFRNRQFGPALVAYQAAKPIVDSSSVVDEDLKWLTILHGAQAANQLKDFKSTIDWTREVTEVTGNESLSVSAVKQDIFLEIGKAYNTLGDSANAIKAWRSAAASLSETGAEATCLVGHQLLQDKKYDDAEREFKKVFFGFGGTAAKPEIQPWQAYARYEAARSNFLRAQASTDPAIRQAYAKIAAEHFQALVDDYPNDKLAVKAQAELAKLKSE